MPSQPRSRPFSLLDALALVAATALGFALTRCLFDIDGGHSMDFMSFRTSADVSAGRTAMSASLPYRAFQPAPRVFPQATFWMQWGVFWACPFLSAWTLTFVPMAFLRTRGPKRRSFSRPGHVAGMAWFVGFVILALGFPQALIGGAHSPEGPSFFWRQWWAILCLALPRAAGIAVAASWIPLALSGRWAPDRGWLDRLGRGLGWSWIGLGLLRVVSSWLSVFST